MIYLAMGEAISLAIPFEDVIINGTACAQKTCEGVSVTVGDNHNKPVALASAMHHPSGKQFIVVTPTVAWMHHGPGAPKPEQVQFKINVVAGFELKDLRKQAAVAECAEGRHWGGEGTGLHARECLLERSLSSSAVYAVVPTNHVKTDDSHATAPPEGRRTVMAWLASCGENWTVCADFVLRGPAKGAVNAISAGGLVEMNQSDWTLRAGDSASIASYKRVWQVPGMRHYPILGAGGNITLLRPLFAKANRTAFAKSAAAVVVAGGWDGLNFDFEPATDVHHPDNNPSIQDGIDFAKLVDETAKALHKENKTLSVDTQSVVGACWSAAGMDQTPPHNWNLQPCPWIRRLFNHDSLAASAVDRSIIMDTVSLRQKRTHFQLVCLDPPC